ncbi:MAG: CotH kinase family protein [Clostridia bacterium]|nr:CotH kinase family protein [Clostridia bacterium]
MKRLFRFLCLTLALCILLCACADGATPPPSDGDTDGDTDGTTGGSDTDDGAPVVPDNTVWLNEICAKNTDDASGRYDWIELYNTGDEEVSLSGWRLSDSKKEPDRFVFPSGTKIAPGGYLVIWATKGEAPTDGGLYTSFGLSKEGEQLYLYNPAGYLADTVEFPALSKDTSWGRSEDGGEIFANLTPSRASTNEGNVVLLSASVLTFSHESGFYDEGFNLTIDAPNGYSVYYTVDCTDPRSPSSNLYSRPIPVTDPTGVPTHSYEYAASFGSPHSVNLNYCEQCFVVRAVAEDWDGNLTQTVTKSYFIGYGKDARASFTTLPIISMTTSPDQIYGSEGLFKNYQAEKMEKQVNLTFFDKGGEYSFEREVGIRIRGASTRNAAQKNLNVYTRTEYDGNATFPEWLFPEATYTNSVVLRSDSRWNMQLGQDYMQNLVSDRAVVTQDSFPVLVFLDGEFFGLYNLYERFDEDFVEAHYGVKEKDVYTVKNGRDPNCDEALAAYAEMDQLMRTGNLADPAVYARLCEMVDMQSLIDLFSIHLYLENGDFSMSQNINAWRAAPNALDPANPYADGKWRFVLYDLDYCIDGPARSKNTYTRDTFSVTPKNPALGGPFLTWEPVINLMKSDAFCQQFVASFREIATVNFDYETKVKPMMDACLTAIYPVMDAYLARYNYLRSNGSVRTAAYWKASGVELNQVTFMKNRASYILGYLDQHFTN